MTIKKKELVKKFKKCMHDNKFSHNFGIDPIMKVLFYKFFEAGFLEGEKFKENKNEKVKI